MDDDNDRELALRFDGTCAACGGQMQRGTRGLYNSAARTVRHIDCERALSGVAGASALREYERRTARDQARVAAQKQRITDDYGSGFIGKVATLLAVDDRPRRSTEVWKQGAVGEERVAEFLDGLREVGVVSLHDRRIPGSKINIDHIAVTPWGVWVIDAKRYLNKRPEMVLEGGFLGIGATEHLVVGRRKKDELIDGVLGQAARVRSIVPEVPVRAALAFVEAEWPLIGGDFTVRDVSVVWPRRLSKLMLRREPPTLDVDEVVARIASHFPRA